MKNTQNQVISLQLTEDDTQISVNKHSTYYYEALLAIPICNAVYYIQDAKEWILKEQINSIEMMVSLKIFSLLCEKKENGSMVRSLNLNKMLSYCVLMQVTTKKIFWIL